MRRDELPVYGIDRTLSEKKEDKLKHQDEKAIRKWFDEVFDRENVISTTMTLQEALKDGIILCELMNIILPGSCKTNKMSSLPFHQMENIVQFLGAASQLGCKDHDLFQTVELYEGLDMNQVINSIYAVARHAHSLHSSIPSLGPSLGKQPPLTPKWEPSSPTKMSSTSKESTKDYLFTPPRSQE
jgi:hypothetical protein